MDRLIHSEGYQQDGLSKDQIEAACNKFADEQKEKGVQAGRYTPLVAESDGKLFKIEAHYQNNGEQEEITIKSCEAVDERVIAKNFPNALRIEVTTDAQKEARAKAEADAKAAAEAKAKAAADKAKKDEKNSSK